MDDFSERASLSRWTYENKFTLRSMTSFSSLEHLNSNNSPFKFNAKELDEETGNYYYGARYYDPKWSIWLSVDPLAEKYPSVSSYAYVANNPVKYIDPDGRRIIIYSQEKEPYEYKNGKLINLKSGEIYSGNDKFLTMNRDALTKLDNASSSFYVGEDGLIKKRGVINEMVKSEDDYVVLFSSREAEAVTNRIKIDPFTTVSTSRVRTEEGTRRMPYEITLAHELGHAYSYNKGFKNKDKWFYLPEVDRDISKDENWTIHFENYFRDKMNIPLRTHYNLLNMSKIFDANRFNQRPVNELKPINPVLLSPRDF